MSREAATPGDLRRQRTLELKVRSLANRLEELARENRELRAQARHDPLTGVLNRRGFGEALARRLRAQARQGGAVCVLMIDLDGMKGLNDRAGHPAGDEALVAVARLLAGTVRASDEAARLGGDEFAIVFAGEAAEAACLAERIRRGVEEWARGAGTGITTSIGVAEVARGASSTRAIAAAMAGADAALYAAKRGGKNRVVCESGSGAATWA